MTLGQDRVPPVKTGTLRAREGMIYKPCFFSSLALLDPPILES